MAASVTFWDRFAERYAKRSVSDPEAYAATLEQTRAYLQADHRVLELGCGTGTTALRLAPHVAAMRATDASPAMIAIARGKGAAEKAQNVVFDVADVARGPWPDAPYDAVLAFNLLHLLPDAAAACRTVHRLLKPGGVFVSKTVCLAGHAHLLRLALPVLRLAGYAPYVRVVRVSDVDRTIIEAGFEIVEVDLQPAKPPRRFVVARRR
jgi:ubiquinone/menaquinone biosynthesis C-methylase UbiE